MVQGAHGYISPGWYDTGDFVPPWNHVTAHFYGAPEILSAEENFAVLGDLVYHFEKRMPAPVSLVADEATARRIAQGTVNIRLVGTRFDAWQKLSQNKSPEMAERIVAELERGEHYQNQSLAREMRHVHRAAAWPTQP